MTGKIISCIKHVNADLTISKYIVTFVIDLSSYGKENYTCEVTVMAGDISDPTNLNSVKEKAISCVSSLVSDYIKLLTETTSAITDINGPVNL
jgi:hypothetical protein